MYRLTNSFPYLLNRVGVQMGELFSRRIAGYGVTLPMYRVMAALWETGDQRLGDLATMTTIEISTLSRLVGEMKDCTRSMFSPHWLLLLEEKPQVRSTSNIRAPV